jgi:hypothetical protein
VPRVGVESPESRSYRIAGLLLVFLVIAAVVFVLLRTLIFDRPLSASALQQALIAAGVGVTVSCLIVWLLNLLQIIPIQEGWSKLLWGVLVVSVLGNSALVYKRFSEEPHSVNAIKISCLRTLEVDDGPAVKHPYSIKTNMGYHPGEKLSYFVAFSDFMLSSDGHFDVEFRTSIEDVVRNRTIFWDDSFKANLEKIKADPVRKQRTEEYLKVAPECVGQNQIQAAFIYKLPTAGLPSGKYLVRSTIKDRITGAIAADTLSIEIQDTVPSRSDPAASSASRP